MVLSLCQLQARLQYLTSTRKIPMPEQSLEDLKRDSLPALRYAELVCLGRSESPNQAYKKAIAGWPVRQAKAARSLAILRRDYGNEALTAFLMEHARPFGSEHAQGAETMELFENVLPGGLYGATLTGGIEPGQALALYRHDAGGSSEYTSLDDIERKHNFSRLTMEELVLYVIKRSFTYWDSNPQMLDPGSCRSAINALNVYGWHDEAQTELERTLFLYAVRASGRLQSPRDLIAAVFWNNGNSWNLQEVIDYLSAFIPAPDLSKAWVHMLEVRREQRYISEVNAPFWEKLSIDGVPVATLAQNTIRTWTFTDLHIAVETGFRSFVINKAMDELERLLKACDPNWRRSEELHSDVEDWLVECLAMGEGSRAAYVMNRFGALLGYHSGNAAGFQSSQVEAHLIRLARTAIEVAGGNAKYGVASALAEFVGDHIVADRFRAYARGRRQPVQLNWTFFVD
jgi:hypothetical protein